MTPLKGVVAGFETSPTDLGLGFYTFFFDPKVLCYRAQDALRYEIPRLWA